MAVAGSGLPGLLPPQLLLLLLLLGAADWAHALEGAVGEEPARVGPSDIKLEVLSAPEVFSSAVPYEPPLAVGARRRRPSHSRGGCCWLLIVRTRWWQTRSASRRMCA